MRLRTLSVRGFRNLADQELQVPREGFALLGRNAQGKSNLLEAVYYLETFRSFRGAGDGELCRFGSPFFRVEGRLEPETPEGRGRTVATAYRREGTRKKVTLDREEVERVGDALGVLGAVVFSPADLALTSDGPRERRRFLDILLSLNAAGYLDHLQRYRQALERRNASLRSGAATAAVAAWDGPLIRHGTQVLLRRRQWVSEYAPTFQERYQRISGGEAASLEYRSRVAPSGPDGPEAERIAEGFRASLAETGEEERRRGWTTVGPHRDELFVGLGGEGGWRSLRRYGSGGQKRTAALALRLCEAATIRRARREPPMVLLDDVFAELDEGRSARLLSLLEEPTTGQLLLTAPKEADIRLRRELLPRWHIQGGRVQA